MPENDRRPVAPSVRPFSELPESEIAAPRPVVDDGPAAMRRLRLPFEADPAGAADRVNPLPREDDDRR